MMFSFMQDHSDLAPRAPRRGRLCIALLVAMLLGPASVSAQSNESPSNNATSSNTETIRLSVSRAVQRAIQHPRALAESEESVSVAKAHTRSEQRWADPNVEVLQEHLVSSPQVLDHWAIVEQSIPIAGRRALRNKGEARVEAAREQLAATKNRLAKRTRVRFFRLLAIQQKRRLVTRHISWLERRIQTLQSRPPATTSPDEDEPTANPSSNRTTSTPRLDALKHRLVQMKAEKGRLEARWNRLAPILLHDVGSATKNHLELSGDLLPSRAPLDLSQITSAARTHPKMKALRSRADVARLDNRAGAWPQQISVGLGFRSSYANENFQPGYFAGVGLDIPLWSALASGPSVEEATFAKRRARWRRQVENRTAKLVALRGQYLELRKTCREYKNQSPVNLSVDDDTTSNTARQKPKNLKNARRRFDTRLHWIELALQTRLAYTELQGLAGRARP